MSDELSAPEPIHGSGRASRLLEDKELCKPDADSQNSNSIVIKDSRNIFGREFVGGVAYQETRLSDRTVSNHDASRQKRSRGLSALSLPFEFGESCPQTKTKLVGFRMQSMNNRRCRAYTLDCGDNHFDQLDCTESSDRGPPGVAKSFGPVIGK